MPDFCIMSEMLDGNCNVWRGMLFGMTSRYPFYQYYSGPSPVPVWQFRKDFDDSEMIGFWEKEKPVCSDNDAVLCTTYYDREKDKMLCCFANFADDDVCFSLIGLTDGRSIFAPYIKDIQQQRNINKNDKITLGAKGGIILILE